MTDADVIYLAGHRLDAGQAELSRDGRPVHVEPLVFDLLLFLARRPDRLVSRDELIEGVWGGRIVSDATISTAIRAARAALGDDGTAQRVIRTVPRRGFRLVAPVARAAAAATPPAADLAAMEIRYLTAPDGVHLARAATGEGPTLVKAASFLNHLQHETESPIWRHWVRELSARFRFLRYDQRGVGLSDREVGDLSFPAFVRDLGTVIEAEPPGPVAILGISQGAAMAIDHAARHPDRVACLVIVGGYAAGWRVAGDPVFHERREALLPLIRAGWGLDTEAFRQVYSSLFFPGGSPDLHASFNELQRVCATPGTAFRIMDALGDLDVRDRLGELSVPVLVAHGRGDQIVPFDAGRRLAAGIPDARFLPLDTVNHVVQEGEPAWPVLIGEMTRFLGQHLGRQAGG